MGPNVEFLLKRDQNAKIIPLSVSFFMSITNNVIDNRIMFSVNFFMDLWVLLSTPFTLIQLASMPYKLHRADFLSTPFTLIMFSVDEKWVARWYHA
jgi:hypothetical protein